MKGVKLGKRHICIWILKGLKTSSKFSASRVKNINKSQESPSHLCLKEYLNSNQPHLGNVLGLFWVSKERLFENLMPKFISDGC